MINQYINYYNNER